jgi:hypothetical protein
VVKSRGEDGSSRAEDGRTHQQKKPHFFSEATALFVWLISHQPAVLFSQDKSATSNHHTGTFPAKRTGRTSLPLGRPDIPCKLQTCNHNIPSRRSSRIGVPPRRGDCAMLVSNRSLLRRGWAALLARVVV